MIRLFLYLVLVLGLGFLFAWVADRPGDVMLDWQGTQYQTSLMVAVAILVTLIAAIMITWAIIRNILQSPAIVSRFFKNRRQDRGYKALSQGLIAASSGNAALARQLTKESGKLLANEPLVGLLDAQTSLLEGKRGNARTQYGRMLENDTTKLVALRGLYIEAEREGVAEAARQYASEAAALEPSLPWAGNAMLRFHSADGEWDDALRTLETNRAAGLIDKQTATKQRAVLLTAQAYSEEQTNPDRAAKLAQQAHKLDPELVPAAVIGAQAYTRLGDIRRASRIIEAVWRKQPHPELAEAYTHVRSGDSVLDRLKRAKHLASLKANHPEGNIAVAQAAIDAMDWKLARDVMRPVITANLTERACLIMAEIEEGEHGDRGRMRDWLSRAVRSQRDAVWTAEGFVSETWLPISPISGEIGAFEWKVPVERLGPPEEVIDIGDLAEPMMAPASAPTDVPTRMIEPELPEAKAETERSVAAPAIAAAAAVAADTAPAADMKEEAASGPADIEPVETESEAGSDSVPKAEISPEIEEAEVIVLKPQRTVEEAEARKGAESPDTPSQAAAAASAEAPAIGQPEKTSQAISAAATPDEKDFGTGGEEEENKLEFPLRQRPDDPGVDPSKVPEKKKFKLF